MKNHFFITLLVSAFSLLIVTGCLKDEDRVPYVETLSASIITGTTAIVNGNFNTDNEIPYPSNLGFIWSENPKPNQNDNKIAFTSYHIANYGFNYMLSDLKPNTTYYFRAFAENRNGIGYGNVESFTTNKGDSSIIKIGEAIPYAAYAILAKIRNDYFSPGDYFKSWGFCIAEEKLPTMEDEVAVLENFYTVHVFQNLKGNTNYHLRAFVILKDDRIIYSSPEVVRTRVIHIDSISNIAFRSAITATSIDFTERVLFHGIRWDTLTPMGTWAYASYSYVSENHLMRNLKPETTYFVWPFVRINEYPYGYSDFFGPYINFTTPPLPDIGKGTSQQPYTTNGAIYLATSVEKVWVKGYIVGVSPSGSIHANSLINCTEPFSVSGYILLAEDPDEVFMGNTLRVILPEGSFRNDLNLIQNPENLGKHIVVEGILHRSPSFDSNYIGLRNVTNYFFID